MRELEVSVPVRAPSGFAIAFLNSYIQERERNATDPHVHLQFPLQHLGGALKLEHDVTVGVSYVPRSSGEGPRLTIRWRPHDSHLFPSFDGGIEAVPAGSNDCTLAIKGSYDAPFGIAGALFDAVIGIRIARTTITKLLEDFRDAIEVDYRERTKWG